MLVGSEQSQQIVCNSITQDLILKDIQKRKYQTGILPGIIALQVFNLEQILQQYLDAFEEYDLQDENTELQIITENLILFAISSDEYKQMIQDKLESDFYDKILEFCQIDEVEVKISIFNLIAMMSEDIRSLYIDTLDENSYLNHSNQQDTDDWQEFYTLYNSYIQNDLKTKIKYFQQVQVVLDSYEQIYLYNLINKIIPNNILQLYIQNSKSLQQILIVNVKEMTQHEIQKQIIKQQKKDKRN